MTFTAYDRRFLRSVKVSIAPDLRRRPKQGDVFWRALGISALCLSAGASLFLILAVWR